jgi:hypothetical protein
MKTKRTGYSARFLSAFLIGALALPGSAAARPELGRTTLRPELSPKVKAGMKENLRAGAEEGSAVSEQRYQGVSLEEINEKIPYAYPRNSAKLTEGAFTQAVRSRSKS